MDQTVFIRYIKGAFLLFKRFSIYIVIFVLLGLNVAALWKINSLKMQNIFLSNKMIESNNKYTFQTIKDLTTIREVNFLCDSFQNKVVFRIPKNACTSCLNEQLVNMNALSQDERNKIIILSHYDNYSNFMNLQNSVLIKVINIQNITFSDKEEKVAYYYKLVNGMLFFPMASDNISKEIIEQYLRPIYSSNKGEAHVCSHHSKH